MPTIHDLRNLPIVSESSFLKRGPATTVLALTQPQGEALLVHLAASNPEVAAIWPLPLSADADPVLVSRTQMVTALFINGIYDSVLSELLAAQETRGGGISYLQPYKSHVIAMLRQREPSPENPIRLYISTTSNLSNVCDTAEIIGWEDKRELSTRRTKEVNEHLRKLQPTETNLFAGVEKAGKTAVNLITIRNLKKLNSLYATSVLRKANDDLPLEKRTRSGGWSEVYDLGDLLSLSTQTREQRGLGSCCRDGRVAFAISKRPRQAARACREDSREDTDYFSGILQECRCHRYSSHSREGFLRKVQSEGSLFEAV